MDSDEPVTRMRSAGSPRASRFRHDSTPVADWLYDADQRYDVIEVAFSASFEVASLASLHSSVDADIARQLEHVIDLLDDFVRQSRHVALQALTTPPGGSPAGTSPNGGHDSLSQAVRTLRDVDRTIATLLAQIPSSDGDDRAIRFRLNGASEVLRRAAAMLEAQCSVEPGA